MLYNKIFDKNETPFHETKIDVSAGTSAPFLFFELENVCIVDEEDESFDDVFIIDDNLRRLEDSFSTHSSSERVEFIEMTRNELADSLLFNRNNKKIHIIVDSSNIDVINYLSKLCA